MIINKLKLKLKFIIITCIYFDNYKIIPGPGGSGNDIYIYIIIHSYNII